VYPQLAKDVVAFVGIAGANHGTTVCRGLETTYYGCNEIAPGTSWLAALNGLDGSRESYGPTHWQTIYDGLEGDPFFVGADEGSPQLLGDDRLQRLRRRPVLRRADEGLARAHGADNRTFPGAYHNDRRARRGRYVSATARRELRRSRPGSRTASSAGSAGFRR
jgi:hypothetical protein